MKPAIASVALFMLAIACGVPQAQVDALTAEVRTTTADLDSAQVRITGLEAKSLETVGLVSALEADVSELQAALGERDSLLNAAKSELASATDELDQNERTIAELSIDLDAGQDNIEKLRQDIDGMRVSLAENDGAITGLEQTIAEQDADLEGSRQEVADLGGDVTLLQTANAGLTAQVTALQAEVDRNSVQGIQEEIDDLKNQRDSLAAKVKQLATLVEKYVSDPDIVTTSSGIACTGSMLPLLHCGDLVIEQTNLKHRDIQEGDIISFQRRDCFTGRTLTDAIIMHRVVDIDGGWFVTQGDNNYTVDSCRLPLINVTGKLLAFVEDIYPEHIMETANYEAIKTRFNDLQGRFDRDLANYQEQVEVLEDAEDDYNDGSISYSKYTDVYDDTEDDRLSLVDLAEELNELRANFFALQDLIIQRNYNDADWAHLVN